MPRNGACQFSPAWRSSGPPQRKPRGPPSSGPHSTTCSNGQVSTSNRRGKDIPSSGRFWIDEPSGEVFRTRLVTGSDASEARADVTVEYRPHAEWQLLLPFEMKEVYDEPASPGTPRAVGTATCSGFRRFGVTVDESIKPPN